MHRFNKALCHIATSLVLSLGVLAPSYGASPATGTLAVTAIVAHSCTVGTSTMAFGTYDPTSSTALSATGNLSLTCSKGTTIVNIGLGNGQNYSSGKRNMAGTLLNTDKLNYSLFQPTGAGFGNSPGAPGTCSNLNVVPWDNLTSLLLPVPTGFNSTYTATVSVCGQIPSNQSVSADNYSDSVAITVNYL